MSKWRNKDVGQAIALWIVSAASFGGILVGLFIFYCILMGFVEFLWKLIWDYPNEENQYIENFKDLEACLMLLGLVSSMAVWPIIIWWVYG